MWNQLTADVRETRQVASERYLELLVKALKTLDNEDDETPIEQVCVRVKLSMGALKLHHSKLEHFKKFLDDGETYGSAIQALQKGALREHKRAMLKWMVDDNVKKPTLRVLMREGKKRATMEWLPPNFKCSLNWATNFRFGIESRSKKFVSARLRPFANWLEKKLAEDGNVSNSDARTKYTELWGAPKSQKQWSNFSARMRNRFQLKSSKVKLAGGKWAYFWEQKKEEDDEKQAEQD